MVNSEMTVMWNKGDLVCQAWTGKSMLRRVSVPCSGGMWDTGDRTFEILRNPETVPSPQAPGTGLFRKSRVPRRQDFPVLSRGGRDEGNGFLN